MVLVWGASWIGIHFQLGVVAPEVSLVWRFGLAATVMMGWAWVAGEPLRHPWRTHLIFAALGLCLFSINFLLFYYGGLLVPSGLMSVVFSLSSIINMALGAAFLGNRFEGRLLIAGLVGATGVAALFAPQIAERGLAGPGLHGLGLCVAGVMFFCAGNLVATLLHRRRMPVVVSNAWGMTYGTGILVLLAGLQGRAFVVDWSPAYIGALLFLALPSSVVAFASYLRLLGRIGAARASYATVLLPVVALGFSTWLEGYRWTVPAFVGLGLVMAGNLLVLMPRRAA